jgi:glutathionyl-hydroquinone reductase
MRAFTRSMSARSGAGLHARADLSYSGRVTVPVLWDKQRHTIVNNESADIIRMFNSAFDGIGARPGDYCLLHGYLASHEGHAVVA